MEVGPGLVGVAVVGGVADAGFHVVGQEETRGSVQGGADGGEMALSASEAARDRVDVLVRPHTAGV